MDALIGQYLEPFDRSIRKRQIQKSKIYFFDTGVVRALQNVAGENLISSTYEYGDLFETFIINEFIKLSSALDKRWRLSYYKTSGGSEVDLVVEKPRGKLLLIEIKSFAKLNKGKLEPLRRLKKEIEHEASYVLSNDLIGQEIDGIRCLHWFEGLKEIFEFDG